MIVKVELKVDFPSKRKSTFGSLYFDLTQNHNTRKQSDLHNLPDLDGWSLVFLHPLHLPPHAVNRQEDLLVELRQTVLTRALSATSIV